VQPVSVAELKGGRNSRVFRVDLPTAEPVVLKFFARPDRLQTETSALEFLWRHGIRAIPRPLAADQDTGCAVLQFVAGKQLHPEEVDTTDVGHAAFFLSTLHGLSSAPESRSLPLASEASLTIEGICSSIDRRLSRLAGLPADSEPRRQLHRFLDAGFRPELAATTSWCREQAGAWWHTSLPGEQQTLSPSDFGFHNALRTDGGELVFLDFEHFGWDDPAKIAADFLLHPHEAMALAPGLKEHFLARLVEQFDLRGTWLADRLRVVLPLFALKWCTILLNEFVPADQARRHFAGNAAPAAEILLMQQLHKAQEMLIRAQNARNLTMNVC
jgi:hypothetical protein